MGMPPVFLAHCTVPAAIFASLNRFIPVQVFEKDEVIARYLLAMSALFFLANRSATGILASKTRLKNPTIISSQLCSPQVTSFVGSAFSGLFGELSKWAVHSIF